VVAAGAGERQNEGASGRWKERVRNGRGKIGEGRRVRAREDRGGGRRGEITCICEGDEEDEGDRTLIELLVSLACGVGTLRD